MTVFRATLSAITAFGAPPFPMLVVNEYESLQGSPERLAVSQNGVRAVECARSIVESLPEIFDADDAELCAPPFGIGWFVNVEIHRLGALGPPTLDPDDLPL